MEKTTFTVNMVDVKTGKVISSTVRNGYKETMESVGEFMFCSRVISGEYKITIISSGE